MIHRWNRLCVSICLSLSVYLSLSRPSPGLTLPITRVVSKKGRIRALVPPPLAPLSVCLFELFIKIDIFVKRDPASLSCHLGNCNLGDNHLRGLAPTICHLRLQHLANGLGLQPETILWVFPTEDRLLTFRLIVKNISHFSPPYTFLT